MFLTKNAGYLCLMHQKLIFDKRNKINKVSSDYEAEKSKQKVRVETFKGEVQKIIDGPVYFNHCFDDDGLQQINSLITWRPVIYYSLAHSFKN